MGGQQPDARRPAARLVQRQHAHRPLGRLRHRRPRRRCRVAGRLPARAQPRRGSAQARRHAGAGADERLRRGRSFRAARADRCRPRSDKTESPTTGSRCRSPTTRRSPPAPSASWARGRRRSPYHRASAGSTATSAVRHAGRQRDQAPAVWPQAGPHRLALEGLGRRRRPAALPPAGTARGTRRAGAPVRGREDGRRRRRSARPGVGRDRQHERRAVAAPHGLVAAGRPRSGDLARQRRSRAKPMPWPLQPWRSRPARSRCASSTCPTRCPRAGTSPTPSPTACSSISRSCSQRRRSSTRTARSRARFACSGARPAS